MPLAYYRLKGFPFSLLKSLFFAGDLKTDGPVSPEMSRGAAPHAHGAGGGAASRGGQPAAEDVAAGERLGELGLGEIGRTGSSGTSGTGRSLHSR